MLAAKALDVINEPLEQEFERLFHEHYPLVYRTAYSVTGTREDAEDVVQTIFLRLYRRGELSGLKENPKAYLYRAAVNAAVSVVRSRRRHILTDDPTEFDRPVEAHTSNREQALQGEFLKAIAQLSPSAVEILILGAFAGALQSIAIRSDAITRYRWMKASAVGYFLSAIAGGFVIPYPIESVFQLVVNNVVAGTVLGLVTSGPLERILFKVQADTPPSNA